MSRNKDWVENFPSLTRKGTTRFLQVLNPFLIGVELKKSRFGDGSYKIYINVYALWGIDKNRKVGITLKECIKSVPDIFFCLKNEKAKCFRVTIDQHPQIFNDIKKMLSNQVIAFGEDISLNSMLDFIDSCKSKPEIASGSSGAIAQILELKYLLSLYFNDEIMINKILSEIKYYNKIWDKSHFELWHGKFEIWFDNLKNIKRENLIRSVNSTLSDIEFNKIKAYTIKQ